MDGALADRVLKATEHNIQGQTRLRKKSAFKEGVNVLAGRRVPNFTSR